MKGKNVTAVAAAIGMLVLILDGKTALTGAAEGIELCIKSVIPSLFPFLILSGLLTAALNGTSLGFLRPLCRMTGIPEGGESLLMVSFLGGYPLGAQSTAQLYRQGQITRQTARRLLMFCSNAGPAFVFGIVGPQFDSPLEAWGLYAIVILSSLAVGILLPSRQAEPVKPAHSSVNITQAVSRAVSVMGRIFAWVVLFRILTAFLDRWVLWLLPDGWVSFLSGILELTVGCCNLNSITDESLRFLAAAVLLNFGGICVWLQTASVVEDLGTGSYIKGKLLQALISGILAWVAVRRDLWGMVLLVLVAVLCREAKKRSSNSAAVGV